MLITTAELQIPGKNWMVFYFHSRLSYFLRLREYIQMHEKMKGTKSYKCKTSNICQLFVNYLLKNTKRPGILIPQEASASQWRGRRLWAASPTRWRSWGGSRTSPGTGRKSRPLSKGAWTRPGRLSDGAGSRPLCSSPTATAAVFSPVDHLWIIIIGFLFNFFAKSLVTVNVYNGKNGKC